MVANKNIEDKVTISFDKGTLKHSDKDYVVYNKDWLRKHFATEVKIMTGHEGYKERPTTKDCLGVKDCVSLKEVEKWLHQYVTISIPSMETQMFEQLEKELPRVTPTQSWIPVTKRLPKEETTVLICTDQGDIDASRIFSYSDGTWEWFASSWCYGEIIAWMPLPEPYIERGNENG